MESIRRSNSPREASQAAREGNDAGDELAGRQE